MYLLLLGNESCALYKQPFKCVNTFFEINVFVQTTRQPIYKVPQQTRGYFKKIQQSSSGKLFIFSLLKEWNLGWKLTTLFYTKMKRL